MEVRYGAGLFWLRFFLGLWSVGGGGWAWVELTELLRGAGHACGQPAAAEFNWSYREFAVSKSQKVAAITNLLT